MAFGREKYRKRGMRMQEFVTLRKLKNTDALSGMHTARMDGAYEALCSKLDAVSREEVKQLAEMTYQEGIAAPTKRTFAQTESA